MSDIVDDFESVVRDTRKSMSSMFKQLKGQPTSAMSENVPEIENEPFLDDAERAANNNLDYPSNAPKIYTPGKQVNNSVFAGGIAGFFGVTKKLEFNCQLAHGSAVRKISNFKSVKELYDRVSEVFQENVDSPADIMFCTLNSYTLQRNLENLLGGQIMLSDFIYVHLKSTIRKTVNINKIDSALGLTITDNGVGIAFIKRIREGSIVSRFPEIKIGDHIESINHQSTVGWRHFEVAKKLRAIPTGLQFSMTLVEPLKSEFDNLAPKRQPGIAASGLVDGGVGEGDLGSGIQSIRFRSGGNAEVQQQMPSEYIQEAQLLIDDELERYVGIRDSALANDIYEFWASSEDADEFATHLDNSLGEGIIPDDAIFRIDEELRNLKDRFK